MICYGRTVTRGCTQEWYETASRDAGKRTRELRKAGWKAFTSPMGPQVTGVGVVKMSLVTIMHGDDLEIPPEPTRVERI